MASRSLHGRATKRAAAMDRMERVHAAATGGLQGRPSDVTELNHALFTSCRRAAGMLPRSP